MSQDHDGGAHEQAATLVEELDDIDPTTIRARVLDLAFSVPPPDLEEKSVRGEWTLPAIAISVSLLLVLGTILIATMTFSTRVRRLDASVRSFLSGEGLVLAEFRRETDARLAEKDRTIMATLDRLNVLETERRQLDDLVTARVAQREQALVAQMETRLEAERSRLESSGVSTTEITERIQSLRNEMAFDAANELEDLRQTAETEIHDRAAELQSAEADARTALELATMERAVLLDQTSVGGQETGRSESELLRLIDLARAAQQLASSTAETAPETVPAAAQPVVDPELLRQVQSLETRLDSAAREESRLTAEIAGLEAQVASLQTSLDSNASSDDLRAELATRAAELESEIATLRSRLDWEMERSEAAVIELDETRKQLEVAASSLRELEAMRGSLRSELAEARATNDGIQARTGAVAQQARTQALRDVVDVVVAYEVGEDTSEIAGLLAITDPDKLAAAELEEELIALVDRAQRAILDAQLEYRPIGTVSLTGDLSVTVQRLVTVSIAEGMLAEIRRTSSTGAAEVIARGTVGIVEEHHFSVIITEPTAGQRPQISDRVFVAAPR